MTRISTCLRVSASAMRLIARLRSLSSGRLPRTDSHKGDEYKARQRQLVCEPDACRRAPRAVLVQFQANSGPPSFRLDFSCLPPRGLQIEPRTFSDSGERSASRSAPGSLSVPRLRRRARRVCVRRVGYVLSPAGRAVATRHDAATLAIRARRGDHGSVLSPLGRGL